MERSRVVRPQNRAELTKVIRVIVVVAATSAVMAASADAVSDFVTPRRAGYCAVSEGEPPLHLVCWRPRDGLTFAMGQRGRATRRIAPDLRGYYDPSTGRLLRFGQTWAIPRFWRCVSRPTGLTCTNRSGHGWWLGRRHGSRLL
jgi:hypothetical protein